MDRREPEKLKAQFDLSLELPRGDFLVLSNDQDVRYVQDLAGNGSRVEEWRDILDPFLLFERKIISDFWQSIQSNRMNIQIEGIDGVLIEYAYIPRKLDWERIYDAMNGLAHHCPVFYIRTPPHLVRTLRRFEAQLKKGEYFQVEIRADIVDHSSPQLTILAQFPGVGMKRAEAIMHQYGTLSAALADLSNWWKTVDGVGKGTVSAIQKMLEVKS